MDAVEIYYFSGTGNSLFIARELQKRLPGCTLVPIAGLLKGKTIKSKAKTVGLIFPVHALTIPIAVKKFIKKIDLTSADYIFAAATREGTIFRGFDKIDRILARKKKKLNAHFIVNMCNNEARHENFKVPDEAEIRCFEAKALEKLDLMKDAISGKMTSREADSDFIFDVNRFTEKMVLSGMALSEYIGGVNYFYANMACTGCGLCEKVCLSQKISMQDNKPVWQKNVLCYMCFACLNYCPKQAVQIEDIPYVKSFTKVNGRYPHPYASAQDIAAQKQ